MPRKVSNFDILTRIGSTVHGPYWQKPMAEDLAVNRRTINRWIKATSPVPDALPDGMALGEALALVIRRHEKKLLQAKALLERYLKENKLNVPLS